MLQLIPVLQVRRVELKVKTFFALLPHKDIVCLEPVGVTVTETQGQDEDK